jgi:hypothetical protein
MKARRVVDLEVLHAVKALSWLVSASSRLAGKPLTVGTSSIFKFECSTGGHGRCFSDACECQCHRNKPRSFPS